MSENVLVNFRLDKDQPLRLRWLASDGAPGDGYKAQVTAIVLPDGARLAMHGSSIMERMEQDGDTYTMSFTGMVGYAADHADRAHVDALTEAEVDYEVDFVHDDGKNAVPDQDYRILERPRALAKKLA